MRPFFWPLYWSYDKQRDQKFQPTSLNYHVSNADLWPSVMSLSMESVGDILGFLSFNKLICWEKIFCFSPPIDLRQFFQLHLPQEMQAFPLFSVTERPSVCLSSDLVRGTQPTADDSCKKIYREQNISVKMTGLARHSMSRSDSSLTLTVGSRSAWQVSKEHYEWKKVRSFFNPTVESGGI